jgi:hypothetical protein
MLFEKSTVVSGLNQVEGFNPASYARVIQKEGQEEQLYLDVAIRKLWFRLKYPLGKIKKSVLSLSENMAAIEARIYLDKNDTEDQYISSGFSQKFRTGDEIFGDKFMESAETAAVGRALADAGFGIQFADVSGERDMEQVDAGIGVENNTTPLQQSQVYNSQQTGTPVINQQVEQSVQQQNFYQQQSLQPQMNEQANEMNIMPGQYSAQAMQRNLPVETLYAQLTYDQAVKVVIQGNGKYTGQTLGQVSVENPGTIDFFANGAYKGPDNLVRAAAKRIMEKAQAA